MEKDFTVIIPTFNRKNIVTKAIESALVFVEHACGKADIIIVDDKSSDSTVELILANYAKFLLSRDIILIENNVNQGVVASRNIAANRSNAKWLVFLDSDNELTMNAYWILNEFSQKNLKAPCLVFRVCDENNVIIGDEKYPNKIFLNDILNKNYGELFGVYNRDVFIDIFSDKLLEKLRRFEVIGVCRVLEKYGCFYLSNDVARIYYTSNDDRLCSPKNLIKDADCLMVGNFYLLKEFFFHMSLLTKTRTFLKIFRYFYFKVFSVLKNKVKGN